MIARVNETDGAPEQVDGLVRVFREVGLPACQNVAGFRGAFLLVDRVTGRWMDVTLWADEASLVEAFAFAEARIANGDASLRQLSATIHEGVVGQTYEVAAEGWPRE
jgi:hypothetical protein